MTARMVDLVIDGVSGLIAEPEHTDIDFHGGPVGEEDHDTGDEADIEREIPLVGAGKALIDTPRQFRLTTTELKLNLIEETKALGGAHRKIITVDDSAVIIMGEGIDVVEIHLSVGPQNEIGTREFGERTGVAELKADSHIIAERVGHHRRDFEIVGIGREVFDDKELIIVLVGLGIRERESRNPLAFRDKDVRLNIVFERFYGFGVTDRVDHRGGNVESVADIRMTPGGKSAQSHD